MHRYLLLRLTAGDFDRFLGVDCPLLGLAILSVAELESIRLIRFRPKFTDEVLKRCKVIFSLLL
jgi:hypothetical protein